MPDKPLVDQLATIDLFREADGATLAALAARARLVNAAAGSTVMDQEDESSDLYAVLQGRVRVTLLSPRGQEVSFRDQQAGTVVGMLAAFDHRPRSASVVAMEPSRFAVFDAATLKAAMATSPPVMDAVLGHLTYLVRQLSERVFEFTTLVARNRVQAELLRLAREGETDDEGAVAISPAPTHAAIAARISTQRETVSREISTLTRMGLVARRGGALVVNDVDALEALVESARDADD